MRRLTILLAACALSGAALGAEPGTTGLEMQKARAEGLKLKAKKAYYPADKWDLSDLPAYVPREKVAGTIRIGGSNYIVDGRLAEYWEAAFRKFHPHARLAYHMPSTRVATALIAARVLHS